MVLKSDGVVCLTMWDSGGVGWSKFHGPLKIFTGKNLYFDGDTHNHTYIKEEGDNQLKIYVGASQHAVFGGGANTMNQPTTIQGSLTCDSTTPIMFTGGGQNATYTLSALYINQNNTSNNDANGYFWERGRLSNSGSAEIRRWTVGARGGQKQMVLTGPGTLTVAEDVVAYGSPSDISLKENIKPIENALDTVSKLKGVTFDWKEKQDDVLNIKEDIGFIAQDVQEVLPELVRENSNGKLSLRDKGIVPILVEAIKDLKAEIEELKKCKKCDNCNCKNKCDDCTL
jgi:hypothetical protein